MKTVKRASRKNIGIIAALSIITLVGLCLRLLYFPNNIYFGYDQARDAFAAREIYQHGDIKLQGPSSSLEGIFHGPLTYYILGILYTLGSGEPMFVFLFFVLLNTISIPVMYLFVYAVTKHAQIGLLAAALFAASFEQTQWAIFISNTSLASFGLLLLFYGLALLWFSKKNELPRSKLTGYPSGSSSSASSSQQAATYSKPQNKGILLAGIGFTVTVQAEVFLLYILLPLFASGFLVRKRFKAVPTRYYGLAIGFFLLGTLSYITSELLFHFPYSKVILKSLMTVRTVDTASVTINTIIERYGTISYNTFFGYNPFIALLLLLCCVLALKRLFPASDTIKRYFMYIWLFSSIVLLLFNVGFANIYHFSVGVSLIVILIVSVVIGFYIRNGLLLALALVFLFYGQYRLIEHGNRNGASVTVVQKGMLLSDEKAVIEYIASKSNGEVVGITALTNPYNINTVWAYVFAKYWPKNQVMPVWVTNFAKGYEGEQVFTEQLASLPCTYFIVYEPPDAIPEYMARLFLAPEDGRSDIIEVHRFGLITVEKRLAKTCQYFNGTQIASSQSF